MVGNKKLMIALFSICLVVIAGLLTTVIVLALPSQTVTSDIGISYIVKDIEGSMSASYKVGASGSETPIASEIEFKQNSEAVSGNLNQSGIKGLTPTDNYVVFTYTFTNDIALAYTVDVTYTGTNTNWTIEYTVNDDLSTGWQPMTSASQVSDVLTVAGAADDTPTTDKLYIRVTLDDTTADASFSGKFSFVLTGNSTPEA